MLLRRSAAENTKASVDTSKQTRSSRPIGTILVAKLVHQQRLFGADPGEERRYETRCQHQSNYRAERQNPSNKNEEQTEIARVPDDTIDSRRPQSVAGLDRNE